MTKIGYRLLLTLLLIFALAPTSQAAAKKKGKYEGFISNKYQYRTDGSQSDQDLTSLMALHYGNPRFDRFSLALEAGGHFDLDGTATGSFFGDIYDTFSNQAVPRIYYGYANLKQGLFEQIRIGRQRTIQMEPFFLDGAVIETIPLSGFVLSAFGGIPVHFYENIWGDDAGDWLAGAALQWTPVAALRFRFEYAHVRDDAAGFRASQGDLEDDLFGASAWLTINKHVDLYGRVTTYGDQPRDVEAASTITFPEKKFTARINAQRQLSVEDVRVSDFDAYRVAGSYRPYTQVGVTVTQGIGKNLAVDAGADFRILDANQAGTAFNHGYQRYFLTASTHDWLWKNLNLSVSGNYYNGTDNTLDNDNAAFSFSASRRFIYGGSGGKSKVAEKKSRSEFQFGNRRTSRGYVRKEKAEKEDKGGKKKKPFKAYVEVEAASSYYLYRYNLLTGNESDDVRTYDVNIQWAMLKDCLLKLGYEFENNRYNQFHTVTSTFIWNF